MIVDASPLWSKNLPTRLRGLCLAREKNWLLAWDKSHWLYLLNQVGDVQAQARFDENILGAAISDDGSGLAMIDQAGVVRGLNLDLSTRWQRPLNVSLLALAWEPLGQFLSLADSRGNVHFFDHDGSLVGQFQSVRPLHHLAFVPAQPLVVGCADFGLVGAFDMRGTWSWRDAPVVHTGSLAVSGDGSSVVLACFSDGLHRYGPRGQKLERLTIPDPVPLAGMDYSGDLLLAQGMSNTLYFLDRQGAVLARFGVEKPVIALAMSALANTAYLVLKDGELVRWKIT